MDDIPLPKEKVHVLLMDESDLLKETIFKGFVKIGGIDISGIAHNAYERIEILRNPETNLLMLDIVVPKHEGFLLFDSVPETNDILIQETNQSGVSYYMLKPFRLDNLYNDIISYYKDVK